MSGCKPKLAKSLTWRQIEAGYAIVNDDGELWRTPRDNSMIVPTPSLARRICDEHRASHKPMTALTMSAWDYCHDEHTRVMDEMAYFLQHDDVCYGDSQRLSDTAFCRQWIKEHHDIHVGVSNGVMPIVQDEAVVARGVRSLQSLNHFSLAAFCHLCRLSHSFVLGLASVMGVLSWKELCALILADDRDQLARWGDDEELRTRCEHISQEARHGFDFVALLSS